MPSICILGLKSIWGSDAWQDQQMLHVSSTTIGAYKGVSRFQGSFCRVPSCHQASLGGPYGAFLYQGLKWRSQLFVERKFLYFGSQGTSDHNLLGNSKYQADIGYSSRAILVITGFVSTATKWIIGTLGP